MEFLSWGIAYDPVPMEINIGLHALDHTDNSMIAVFAHEIAHSFDSCRWSAFFQGDWPFQKVGTCLRQWARPRDDSRLEEMAKNGKMTKELADSLKANPTCNKSNYPPIGIQADQLPETFADWFAVEVIAKLAIKEIRKDLCVQRTLNPVFSYLSNSDRLYKITLARACSFKEWFIKALCSRGLSSSTHQ